MQRALNVLEAKLLNCTFLVGEAVTLADIVVSCSLLNAFKLVFDGPFLAPFPSLVRWFTTCKEQPEFVDVLGPTAMLAGEAGAAPAPAPAKEEKAKKEKPAKEEKKEKAPKEKKEAPKKEAKK